MTEQAHMDSAEKIADALDLANIEVRIAILNKVIEESKSDGDERWKTTARPQAERLNEARAILLKRANNIPPITIECRVGDGRVVGVVAHG